MRVVARGLKPAALRDKILNPACLPISPNAKLDPKCRERHSPERCPAGWIEYVLDIDRLHGTRSEKSKELDRGPKRRLDRIGGR